MSKYKLEMQEEGFKTSLEFDSEDLGDVLANIEIFLRGCGFIFDGALDIHEGEVKMNAMHYVYRSKTDREFDDVIKNSDELDMEFKND
jgi:hypothetical protein